jgi:hypothetical protein
MRKRLEKSAVCGRTRTVPKMESLTKSAIVDGGFAGEGVTVETRTKTYDGGRDVDQRVFSRESGWESG